VPTSVTSKVTKFSEPLTSIILILCTSRPGFEVSIAVHIKSSVFYITPCSPVKIGRHLRGTYRLHLQGIRINQARKQQRALSKLSAPLWAVFFSFHFDPEDDAMNPS
jgi:hypothetical protein